MKRTSILLAVCLVVLFVFSNLCPAAFWYKTYPVEWPIDCNGKSGKISLLYDTDQFYVSNHMLHINTNYPAVSSITASATPSVDLSAASLFSDTPTDNEDQTITGTGADTIAGAVTSLKFIATGSADETITFGTGFISQGTLTVDTTAARYWVVTFVSDGTSWVEMCRSATSMQ